MLPKKHEETYATGMVKPKTTALFFDKLWVHPLLIKGFIHDHLEPYRIPPEVCLTEPKGVDDYYDSWERQSVVVFREKDREKIDTKEQLQLLNFETWDLRSIFQIEAIHHFEETDKKYWNELEKSIPPPPSSDPYDEAFKMYISTRKRNKAIDFIVDMYAKRGIKLTPVYLKLTEFDEVTTREVKGGLEICINNIETIDESELTWEQVFELRNDEEAKDKLDRLRRWFTIDLAEMNEGQIKAVLEEKLNNYEYSLKKHGIKTMVGGITSVISFIAGPPAISLLTSNPLAAVTGGLVIASGAAAWIADKMIKKSDIKRDEIAYIYEVKNL